MSPVDDTFISGSLDRTIRLWDLRSSNCQVRLYVSEVSSEEIYCKSRTEELYFCQLFHGNLAVSLNKSSLRRAVYCDKW